MTNGIILTETCHYCRHARALRDVMRLPGGVRLCISCYEKHQVALIALSRGKPPSDCSECHTPLDDLQKGDRPVQMALHYEDGFYRLMCLPCSETYIQKRRDLYGPTQYGWEQKLD